MELVRGLRKNILGLPWMWPFAPFLAVLSLVIFLSPIWLAMGGFPGSALILWLLWPAMVGGAHQQFSHKPMDWVLALWPLAGFIPAAGLAWAFLDRLRGINHWRGRDVKIAQ
jgi:hypothetical protein